MNANRSPDRVPWRYQFGHRGNRAYFWFVPVCSTLFPLIFGPIWPLHGGYFRNIFQEPSEVHFTLISAFARLRRDKPGFPCDLSFDAEAHNWWWFSIPRGEMWVKIFSMSSGAFQCEIGHFSSILSRSRGPERFWFNITQPYRLGNNMADFQSWAWTRCPTLPASPILGWQRMIGTDQFQIFFHFHMGLL